MLITEVKFNKDKDIKRVYQFGFVDITKAFESGSVPSSVVLTEDQYNMIDNPDSILGRPADIFEAYRMKEYVNSVGSSGGNSGSESADSVPEEN